MMTPEQQAELEAVDPAGLSQYALACAYFKAGWNARGNRDAEILLGLAARASLPTTYASAADAIEAEDSK